MTRRAGPPLPWICAVTDHTVCQGGFSEMERTILVAISRGVNVVHLRERSLPGAELYELGRRLRRATSEAGAALIVNDRLDLALALGADGVHLRADSLPVAVVRDLAPNLLIGRSVHGVAEAVDAERWGADYLFVGTIFPSATHPDQPVAGPHLIRKVRAKVRVPIVAIGGITADNAAQPVADGAAGVAVIRAILGQQSPEQAVMRLVERVREAWPSAILHRGN